MIRQNFSLSSLLALLDTASRFNPLSTPRIVPAQRPARERYAYKPHNGAQEMARRKRQMDRIRGTWHLAPRPDMLLVQSNGSRLHLNSHGEVVPFYP